MYRYSAHLLSDGEVSYQGEIFNIERFDLWFEPLRNKIPVYVAAVFPKMLEVCGEIAQGALLTWCTLEHAQTAAHHVALGAKRAGRDPAGVEVATLVPCAVTTDRGQGIDSLRNNIARYTARFPRYRRLMGEAGFAAELQEVRRAWLAGDKEKARRLVPGGLIDRIALVGTGDQVRQGLDNYRKAGITQPIISPRVSGPTAKQQAMDIIRACAP